MTDRIPLRRVLVSLSAKEAFLPLLEVLQKRDVEILASGGTAAYLEERGLPFRSIEDWTAGAPLMGGRVKTLHPALHGAILARRDHPEDLAELEARGWGPIDMVICCPYPFERGRIETIDVGGPALLRGAAKNHEWVAAVSSAAQVPVLVEELEGHEGSLSRETRLRLAREAFRLSARLDAAVARSLDGADPGEPFPERLLLDLPRLSPLRYGENPHQRAALYASPFEGGGIAQARLLSEDGELSCNNILDGDAACRALEGARRATAVVIKHGTPCGFAEGDTIAEALDRAFEGDPLSAYGSVVALNRSCDEAVVTCIRQGKRFVEVLMAPDFEEEALRRLRRRRKLRILPLALPAGEPGLELRSVGGGILVQERDAHPSSLDVTVAGAIELPSSLDRDDLDFAWRCVEAARSNAVVLVKDRQLVGVGAGQCSRVDAMELACRKAGERARGGLCASDAFLPFPDAVERAAEAGVVAMLQPGGSIRDAEVLAAADRLGLAMLFTGRRAFRH